jgi:hypothetical protein
MTSGTKGALTGGVTGAFFGAATGWLVTGGSKLAAIGGGVLGALVMSWVGGSSTDGATTGTAGLPAGVGHPQMRPQQRVRQ